MTVRRARTHLDRLVGGLRLRTIAPHEGIWIEPCSAVHTFGMRAAIDIILLDAERTVLAVRSSVKPNRPLIVHLRARTIVEMGAGFLATASVAIGDRLELDDGESALRGEMTVLKTLSCVLAEDGGATLAEYALIISLLALAILVGVGSAGSVIQTAFKAIGAAVASA